MCVVTVTKKLKESHDLSVLAECDDRSIISGDENEDLLIQFSTPREDLRHCPCKQAILTGIHYICSIRKAMSEREFTETEILFLEREIEETKQDIIKCL